MVLTRTPAGLSSAAAKRAAPVGGDGINDHNVAGDVPPVHDDFGTVPAQRVRGSPADAGSRAGDQGRQAFEVPLLVHGASFRLITSTMDGAGPAWASDT